MPFRLFVGFQDLYYIPHGEPVKAMFKSSRDLSMKPIVVVAMRDQFGLSPEDLALYMRDGSGSGSKPRDGWENIEPDHRIFYHLHRDLHALLNGGPLDRITERFIDNYTTRLRTTLLVGDEWTALPDLFAFLRTEMFHAACTAFVGEHFLALNPNACRDFWEFDSHVLTFIRRTPRWMAPKAYAARDRLVAAVQAWRAYAREHADYRDPALADADHDPYWGARLMRARAEMFDQVGFSAHGAATMDLGFLWAANANVIPATGWVLINVLLSENLTERVMAEMADSFDEKADAFDVAALCSKPLLNGAYLEALRYCTSTTSARNPETDDFQLGGWHMPRDAVMLSMSWFGGHDPHYWNTGRVLPNGKPEHPVDSYWAERFLEYPGDPASGPTRKPDEAVYRSDAKRMVKTAQDDKTAKASGHIATLQGYFYPYGGGANMCPGRHFAKQEMLAAVAVMMREFEIELTDPVGAQKAKPDPKIFATGALGPDRKLPVRVRRRRHK